MAYHERYRGAVFVWLFVQMWVCAFHSALVAFVGPRPVRAVLFFAVTSAVLSVIFVAIAANLIWRVRSRRRIIAATIGAVIGLMTPVLAFVVFFAVGTFLHEVAHIDSRFVASVFLAFLGTSVSLFGCGLLGGTWAGYVRSAVM